MASASMQVAENRGATLTVTYNTQNLSVTGIELDATSALVPTYWEVLQNGAQVYPASGEPLAIQPGSTDTWTLPHGTATMGTITDSQGVQHVVTPLEYQLLTWN